MTLRYQQVALPGPGAAPVELWVVHAREQQPPPAVEPLDWFLLTTLRVTSTAEATRILRWYALRWRIEESLGEHPGDDDTRGTTTELSNTRMAATSEDT